MSEAAREPRRRRRLPAFVRWIHIYLSMIGFFALLFFSITGLTLNHPTWFQDTTEQVVQAQGKVDRAWLGEPSEDGDARPETVKKLEIVEHLRSEHGIHYALSDFQITDVDCVVMFKGPAYSADAFVDRESGDYELTIAQLGWVGILNDFHKGRDTGSTWSWLIDVSAILGTLVGLTGLWLLLYLKSRRRSGLIVAAVGTVAVLAFALWVLQGGNT